MKDSAHAGGVHFLMSYVGCVGVLAVLVCWLCWCAGCVGVLAVLVKDSAHAGGVHFLMSYVGCVGVLMKDSAHAGVLKSTFEGVEKMLQGKNYSPNVRALRMLFEEFLRLLFIEYSFNSMDDLLKEIEKRSTTSRTARLWAEVVVKLVLNIFRTCRKRRRSCSSCLRCECYEAAIFRCKTCKLCPLWLLLQRIYKPNVTINSPLF